MLAARKIVLDVFIIHPSIILNRVNGRAGHCHDNDRHLISRVQANKKIFYLTLRARSLFFRRRPN